VFELRLPARLVDTLYFRCRHESNHAEKFTYSRCERPQDFADANGLSKHEGEVHNTYGGRQKLYCLYKICKRSTENPFARPENLNKHLRNDHNGQGIDTHEAARNDARRPKKGGVRNRLRKSTGLWLQISRRDPLASKPCIRLRVL
jgi:hypothetical protein